MNSKTPDAITPEIISLCEKIAPGQIPIYLDVTPDTNTKARNCFIDVQKKVAKFGGEIKYGWQIWTWAKVMIEAEFHCVYRTPGGQLLDITPKEVPTSKILFLPDASRIYEGKQVNNVRMALYNSPLIHEYIDINDKIFEEMNKGDLAYAHGPITLPATIMAPLMQRKMVLQKKLNELENLKVGRNDHCPCYSGKKYKKCHGQ